LSFQKITSKAIADKINAKLFGKEDIFISDITHDSRQVQTGTLFVAIKGLTMDGHRFVEDVMRRNAVGIISELDPPDSFNGIWLKVGDARKALADAAAIIHGNPSDEIKLVGITGTNGKTTTTYLILALAEANGEKSAMLTTVEYRIGNKSQPAVRTTPEASDTQRFLRQAINEGCQMVVMETSSQAIHLRRCDGLHFKVAVFTNLTRDHLDYHLTMENYFDAKKELFDGRIGTKPASAVVNIDDKWGQKLVDELRKNNQKVVSISQKKEADLTAEKIDVSLIKGTSFLLKTPAGIRQINSPLVGKPHVYNMLTATAAALEIGYDLDKICQGLEVCIGAPGRFERVVHNGDFAVIVDYAHSDDALFNTLKTARELTEGRIITVFGCGGDRDKTKRKPMGEVAGKYSDLVVVTSDNPRSEDPLQIIKEIEVGLKLTDTPYLISSDRREAIHRAISKAKPNDVVIIAGKGHETYQIIGGDKFHFDDREIATEALEELDS
jgi:UDP-N-acetylmuramoyl-L-alanyl-D-glutamate--2,6-diaminopimelate ligase